MDDLRLKFWEKRTSAGHKVTGYHSEPSGRPVLHFIHGNGYNCLVYRPMLDYLAQDFDLFLHDTQGHGYSENGEGFLGWNRTAELCAEVWEDYRHLWGDVPNYGTGHSFGGVLTALMMARDPQLFQRAVLLDPILFSPGLLRMMQVGSWVGLWQRNSMAERTRKRRRQWPDRDSALESIEGRGMFRGWHPQALRAYVNHALADTDEGVELMCPPEHEADIFSAFPKGLWRQLKRVKTPTHLIYGEETYDFVVKSVSRWSSMNDQITTQVMPGGHCFMQQHPHEAAEAVVRALT